MEGHKFGNRCADYTKLSSWVNKQDPMGLSCEDLTSSYANPSFESFKESPGGIYVGWMVDGWEKRSSVILDHYASLQSLQE